MAREVLESRDMRNVMVVLMLVGCEPAAVSGLALSPPPVDAGADLNPAVDDMAHEAVDMAEDVVDFSLPPDMADRHFVCIGRKCQPGQWCADYGQGLGCDEQTGWTYCALAGTECHRDAECCTRRVGNGFERRCVFWRCR